MLVAIDFGNQNSAAIIVVVKMQQLTQSRSQKFDVRLRRCHKIRDFLGKQYFLMQFAEGCYSETGGIVCSG